MALGWTRQLHASGSLGRMITDWVPCDGQRSRDIPRRKWWDDLVQAEVNDDSLCTTVDVYGYYVESPSSSLMIVILKLSGVAIARKYMFYLYLLWSRNFYCDANVNHNHNVRSQCYLCSAYCYIFVFRLIFFRFPRFGFPSGILC